MRKLLFYITLLLVTATSLHAKPKPFLFNQKQIKPGTKQAFLLPVITATDSTFIPVTVFHGIKSGPVLGITAGVHGLEYAPIMAAQALNQELDPTKMSGTVILVQLANVPGFLNRSLRVNPLDNKNLNRVFPGKANSTSTDKIAWIISNQIIARCNYFLDVHDGDANGDLRPYSGYYNYFDKPAVSEKAKQMALALGFDFIVQFGNEQSLTEASIYCSREATKRNIPAADIECGGKGRVDEKNVLQIQAAIKSLMRHLGILEGQPNAVQNPAFIAKRTTVNSEHTGIFYSDFTSGDYVKKGMQLGFTTDFFGNKIGYVTCPIDGIILYKTFNPPIKKGDGLFNIGHIQ
ncbi:succinylglutamate desuccinylase/aspartoacylase family protein [Adhaeribacter rhizoryzae]|uniref:Succinylglutamate desuccinylase/Aspartoacylase catalytic domain-containing protein n=1 Tax=Adhaeribacter rhizoryzae TaxID=2607907 RepID=A0A5M6D2B8_9BACT|nr:M14 family metallopeptidase [Adhaeribacter rhizoryzae]KAA5541657.1 hypothetical protein F0145_20005 [Adhaeribacter rhizoryzae]